MLWDVLLEIDLVLLEIDLVLLEIDLVLLEIDLVLLEIDLVFLDKIVVIGLLRCASLTLRSRQSRQVPAGAMSPLVTPSPFLLIVE